MVLSTHDFYPRPTTRFITAILSTHQDNECDGRDSKNTAPEHPEYRAACFLPCADLEPPYPRKELSVCNDAKQRPVCRECEIIEAHRRRW